MQVARQAILSHQVERISGGRNQSRRARLLSIHPLCVLCQAQGRVTAAVEIDHIVPLWMGGGEHDSNLQPLCGPCHRTKTVQEAARRAG